MELEATQEEKNDAKAKSNARRSMLATVAAGKADAVKELEAARAKAREMAARRDRSVKAATAKIIAFKREAVTPAARAARECDEAIHALWVEFVPIELVKARDAAENLVAHARLKLNQHDRDEAETKRLLAIATKSGRIDKTSAKEWKMKITASAKERKHLTGALDNLTAAALAASTALVDARAAALLPEAT